MVKPPIERSLFLSVHPGYANAILTGTKTVELRRRRPNILPGALAFVYATSPIKSVLGLFFVRQVISGTVDELWNRVHSECNVDRNAYDQYFNNSTQAHAIEIASTRAFAMPLTLDNLRQVWPKFRPPQSFSYLIPGDDYAYRIFDAVRRRLGRESGHTYPAPIQNMRNQLDMDTHITHQGQGGKRIGSVHASICLEPGTPAHRWIRTLKNNASTILERH